MFISEYRYRLHCRERFIPLTRRTTVAYLMQDEAQLTSDERAHFEQFALALDGVIATKYSNTLQELKVCMLI